ncbi:MAG: acetyl/propionyl/methylcrotonyl-CoA carboxylase subunit alpha [Alphaproteobacteria bacterium]|nr:acetyl/propionyl/methylcrotonyl-CoA carboxylase subunit alpha [Alphaproteobacteria bacterium]
MFKKILIANRGEIACRVIRTCRRLGIKTVAVHSEADAGALHVEMADEAVAIGAPAAAESYLKIERIVDAAKRTGADAIHPGYGFLSENAKFADALDKAGIVFIGPPMRAVHLMGDKIESKKLARAAGVNTIPGIDAPAADAAEALAAAKKIGYPVMIKAAAGGGGKGMRIAKSDAEVESGFRSATNEARSSFGDARVFIEKFVEEPRHIEIQVFADKHGNAVYLGERECSIQRRHQKVIEEAPSPFLDEATRKAMGEQAVKLAKAVDYVSAGTVEFVVDAKRNFYFLEMNTRLQVEHPVTEEVTGLDLVELMIRVAAGEKLPFAQKDVRLKGAAIEARVYAEDPVRNFLPAIGRLVRYREPAGEGIRVDSGVREGDQISIYYDPMIAKLIAAGPDRATALARLGGALDAFVIGGLTHNLPFLSTLARHPRVAEGRFTTHFIAETFPGGWAPAKPEAADAKAFLAVAGAVHRRTIEREASISGQLPGHEAVIGENWVARMGGTDHALAIRASDGAYAVVAANGNCRVETDWQPGMALFRGRVDGRSVAAQVAREGSAWRLSMGGMEAKVHVVTPRTAELAALMPDKAPPDMSRFLLSPMPGLLASLAVKPGQDVKAGDELAVVEAMKMENVLRAERDGRVAKLHAQPGASLAVDEAILEFE